jgi:enterochelin esterase-like enzyme
MTIWKRWIQRSVLCGLVLGGLVAFATIASASDPIPSITDHAAMAAWYEKAAATSRQNAQDMHAQIELYKKDPSLSKSAVVGKKIDFVQHCQGLAAGYKKAAEEAEELAKGHHDMMK